MHGSEKDINHLVLKKNITYVWMTSMWLSEIRKWVIGRHSTVIIASLHSYYFKRSTKFHPRIQKSLPWIFHSGSPWSRKNWGATTAYECIWTDFDVKGPQSWKFVWQRSGWYFCFVEHWLLNWSWALGSTFLGLQFLKNSFLFLIFF